MGLMATILKLLHQSIITNYECSLRFLSYFQGSEMELDKNADSNVKTLFQLESDLRTRLTEQCSYILILHKLIHFLDNLLCVKHV